MTSLPKERLLVVTHDNAGAGSADRSIRQFTNAARRYRYAVDTLQTETPQDLSSKITAHISDRERIGYVGGDGSFRSLVQAFMETGLPANELPVIFGIRGGHINIFEKAAGNYRRAKNVPRMLDEGKVYEMDVIRARIDGGKEHGGQDLYFVSNASIGLSGRLMSLNDRLNGGRGGLKGYIPHIPEVLNNAQDFRVSVTVDDGEKRELKHLSEMFFLNGGKGAIVDFSPEERYDDGKLLAVSFNGTYEDSPQLNAYTTFVGAVHDLRYPGQPSPFEERKHAKKISIEILDGKEVPFQLDGDQGGVIRKSLELEVCERAIRVMAVDQRKRRVSQRLLRRKGRAFGGEGQSVLR